MLSKCSLTEANMARICCMVFTGRASRAMLCGQVSVDREGEDITIMGPLQCSRDKCKDMDT